MTKIARGLAIALILATSIIILVSCGSSGLVGSWVLDDTPDDEPVQVIIFESGGTGRIEHDGEAEERFTWQITDGRLEIQDSDHEEISFVVDYLIKGETLTLSDGEWVETWTRQ